MNFGSLNEFLEYLNEFRKRKNPDEQYQSDVSSPRPHVRGLAVRSGGKPKRPHESGVRPSWPSRSANDVRRAHARGAVTMPVTDEAERGTTVAAPVWRSHRCVNLRREGPPLGNPAGRRDSLGGSAMMRWQV
jgi:hypothetical protein